MIVEDNYFIGNKIFDTTKKISNLEDVILVKSLKEATSLLNDTKFEFIILDLNLPDGNGIELLKWLKEKSIETKVFVFSTNTELKQICLRNGAFAFFDKAKDFDVLIETLKNI